MNDEGISDGGTTNRTKAVIAVVFSVLLVGSVVAPAYGMKAASAAEPSVETADAAQSMQSMHATGHPATLPGADATTLPAEGSPSSAESDSANDSAVPENATTKRVTLVTGHTVTVVETENRTRYRVDGGERVRKVSTGNATYVFPVGVDFSKFDRHLFDVDFLVSQNLTDAETDSIPVIVSEDDRQHFVATADRSPGGTLDAVAGAQRRATLESIDAEAGTLDKGQAARAYADLAADADVERVSLDVKYRLDLDDAESAVSAPAARETHGVSGNDVKIAVLDSGIDESHSAIDRVVAEKDFTGEGHTDDLAGHGTHVAGIIASDDETYTGMAPNASLMDVRVLGENNWGYTSWIIDGMEYADANGADVVSMSIGGPVYYERSNDRYTDAVNEIVANGTLVVTSAGNAGPGYGTVNTPGVQSKALTVGATNASSGDVAWFSSRGPTPHGYYLKPNLVAPGVGVMSAEAGTDGFTAMSGTSMATPAVSGVAALLLEARPDLSPAEVRGILTTTSDPLGGRDVYEQGAGEVNATDAVGAKAVVTPGTVDFGTFGNNTTVDRTISVSVPATAESSVTLNATSVTATNIQTGEAATAQLNRSSVTVSPGETERINLTVDTGVPHGVYSGRVSFDGGEYTAAFGFVRAHEVTIEKTGIDGTVASADADPVWLFADRSGPLKTTRYEGYGQLNGSSATFHVVEGGKYHVLSDGFDEDTGQPIVVSETMTLDDDRTVSLNESDTVAYELDVSELEAKHGPLSTRSVEVNYFKVTDEGPIYFGSLAGADADGTTVRFSNASNLGATVERLLVPEAATGDSDNFSAEAVYHLLHEVNNVSGPRTTSVAPSDLAEKSMTYHRTAPDESYDVSMVASSNHLADLYYSHTVTDGIGDRRHQMVYLNEGIDLHGVGATAEAGATDRWNLSASYTTRHEPGERYANDLNQHPYTGDVFWDVFDGELVYYGAAQVGQGGHAFEDDVENSIRVSRNGTVAFSETFSNGTTVNYTDLAVRPNTDLEVTMAGNNGATSLSTRTVTTYRGTYDPGEDYAPPEIRGVAVRNLSTNNTGGGNVRIVFTTDADATAATVKLGADASTVPFDGTADGWKSASVERVFTSGSLAVYEATFDVGEQFGERAGPMDFAVRTVDENGNEVEITTFDAFRVDARKPTVEFAAMGATDATTTVPDGPIYTNESLTTDLIVNGTPGDAESVRAALSADFANFRTETRTESTGGKEWTFAENLSEYPDDGNYTVEAVGVDRHGNVERTEAGPTVVLDRDAPDLGATVTETAGNDARVTLTSDEPLESDTITATVENPAGNDEAVSLTKNDSAGEYAWDGTFALDGDGTYDVTASAADRAGNLGRANSTVEIESVDTKDGKNVTVVLEKSGMFIEFWTNDTNVQSTVTVTESRSALAPLTRNLAGLNFLNGELGKELTDNLDEATIGIPVDESELPPGIARKDVTISYYDKSNGNWKAHDTSVRNVTVNGEEGTYWVTDVTHFSTYGAVAEDDDAPTVSTRLSPTTFDYGTSKATVEFEYDDDVSGVNASAVELYFDGDRVTDDPAANVTGAYATYDATELDGGDHTARVTVVDEAGNAANDTASFTVQADAEAPTVLDVSPAGGTEFESGTGSATLRVEFADDLSGVDADTVEVRFDGEDVTADATVTNDSVTYVADSLSDGSSYTLELHLRDRDGNAALYTYAFHVAEPSSGGSGGGGGGNVPPPAVQVETTALSSAHVEAKVVSARADSPGYVSLPDGLRGGDATFRTVTVVPKSEGPEPRFLLDAVASETVPDGTAAFDAAGEALGYLTVTPTYVTDGELDSVGVEFDVGTATVRAPESVALYHHADDGWERLDTEFVGERGGSYRFRASADATGTYAVALAESTFEVRDASLDASTIPVGGTATVSATVENVGTETGTYAVELTADGEVVETTEVTLAAGERTTVHFDRTFETGGEYEVAVGAADAGTLVVSADATTHESGASEADEDDAPGEGGDGGVSGFGVLVAVAALLAAALFARRRTE